MKPPQFVVAIDGPAASGKSTVALALAKRFSWERLDSGSFYRYVTLNFLRKKIDWKDQLSLKRALESLNFDYRPPDLFLEGIRVTDLLRSPEVERYVSEIARIPMVREKINRFLRDYAAGKKIVVEGRDIGTVVFPRAQVKIFLTAQEEIRTRRRAAQSKKLPFSRSEEEAKENIRFRDAIDSSREIAPTRPASDAVIIDTSTLSLQQTIEVIAQLVEERLKQFAT